MLGVSYLVFLDLRGLVTIFCILRAKLPIIKYKSHENEVRKENFITMYLATKNTPLQSSQPYSDQMAYFSFQRL